MAARLLLILSFILLGVPPLRADDLELPGLRHDSQVYVDNLTKRFPAGGTPAVRKAAEQQAAAAIAKQDWPAAVTALEARVAQGQATAKQFLDLATAQLRKAQPEPRLALFAAWANFNSYRTGVEQIPGMLLMAEAAHALNLDAQALNIWQAIVERAPDNPTYAKALTDTQRAVGVLVRRVRTEADADPPRACVEFVVPPVRRSNFAPQDWITLTPPVPDSAVTREADQICVSGLPPGTTTLLTVPRRDAWRGRTDAIEGGGVSGRDP